MRISTEIGSFAKFIGEERAVELVAQAGFDCYDFSMMAMAYFDYGKWCIRDDYESPLRDPKTALAHARHIRRVADSLGITCNQSHAPFPVFHDGIRRLLPYAIECTAEVGGKICVIHPANNLSAEENAVMFRELLPIAKSYGIKIATENMWNWRDGAPCSAACSSPADFVRHVDVVADPDFGACLDIGHAEMRGMETSAPEMIHALGSRLIAIHLHDNDRFADLHALPYTMQIDFDAVLTALAEVGYQGDLTLEADRFISTHYMHDIPAGVMELGNCARRLRIHMEAILEKQGK